MITASNKTKQYLLITAKVLILTIVFVFIYRKLSNDRIFTNPDFFKAFKIKSIKTFISLGFFLLLAVLNWFFEILKWQTLVSTVQKINFRTAMRQSLSALTVSLATPNRIGDYGAKAVFFEKSKRKKVLFLNLIGNTAQLMVTTVFGIVGLIYLLINYEIDPAIGKIIIFLAVILVGILGVYIFRKKTLLIKGLSFTKIWNKFKCMSAIIKLNVLAFSILRYLIFGSLFYILLRFFGATIIFDKAIFLIFAMYLLVSIIPTFFIFDVVVRGGVAVWLFAFVGTNEIPVLCTVLSMWLLNFLLPAVLGSIYVVTFKLQPQ